MQVDNIRHLAQIIRDMLGEDFDDETFLDTLDGETDVMDIIASLVKARAEAKANETAARELAAEWGSRARRMADKQKSIAAALGAILDATGMNKINHPLATISRTKPRAVVSIINENEIPTQLTIRQPDKKAILEQMKSGSPVPGAELTMGEPGVMVRIK